MIVPVFSSQVKFIKAEEKASLKFVPFFDIFLLLIPSKKVEKRLISVVKGSTRKDSQAKIQRAYLLFVFFETKSCINFLEISSRERDEELYCVSSTFILLETSTRNTKEAESKEENV
jgi:hypothetical protein